VRRSFCVVLSEIWIRIYGTGDGPGGWCSASKQFGLLGRKLMKFALKETEICLARYGDEDEFVA